MIGMLRNALLCTAMTVAFAMPASAAPPAPKQAKILVRFDKTDGEDSFASMTEGSDGNLYGTTVYGGANDEGTIFRMSLKGKQKVLYSFCSQTGCADGANGEWLTLAADGNFYGTTLTGGNAGVGTIFEITPSGKFTTLYSFCSQTNCTDGANATGGLLQTSDGTFWGATIAGGANNKGTIYKFTPGNAPTVVYSFCAQANCTDGYYPYIGLTLASDGNFYGVTTAGGASTYCSQVSNSGCGTVFRLTSSGTLTTLYSFCAQPACTDGGVPQGQLIQAKDGNLYGTTDAGGAEQYGGAGQGTVFKISLTGTLTTVYTFCSGSSCTDGLLPYAGVIQATNGDFYGTTAEGGPEGYGSVYRITPKGKFSVVTSFNMVNGADLGSVMQASNGMLYGGSIEGGGNKACQYGCGVLYRVSPKGGKAYVMEHPGIFPPNRARRAFPVTPLGVMQH